MGVGGGGGGVAVIVQGNRRWPRCLLFIKYCRKTPSGASYFLNNISKFAIGCKTPQWDHFLPGHGRLYWTINCWPTPLPYRRPPPHPLSPILSWTGRLSPLGTVNLRPFNRLPHLTLNVIWRPFCFAN